MIKIEGLKKDYPGFSLDVSLSVTSGSITGLIGRNGAGKSTVIKAILNLIKPDAGTVTVFGKNANILNGSDKQKIGTALADSGFSNYITVNAVRAVLKAMYNNFDDLMFNQCVNAQKLPLNKPIKEFSTGMKAKLRVITALTHNADLIILDEPTAGLDIVARNEILNMLREYMLRHENAAILISSHISTDIEGLCDDVYLIHDGRVTLHEDTDVLLGNYGLLKLTESMYDRIDKSYIIKTQECSYGYNCLTNKKQFYLENYPDIVIENGNIDDLIIMMSAEGGI